MQGILLTVLKANTEALKFYAKRGFEVDETSPETDEGADYDILSVWFKDRA